MSIAPSFYSILPHQQTRHVVDGRRTPLSAGATARLFTSGASSRLDRDITLGAPDENGSADKVKFAITEGKYAYQKLQEAQSFRLMTLLPGQGKERLRCELKEASYGTEEYYESLPQMMALISVDKEKRIHVKDSKTGKVTPRHSAAVILGDTEIPGPPPYRALSYVWGSREPPAYITCDNKELRITQNLAQALYQLRSKDKSSVLWIDGICINQDDIDKRAQQVKLMGRIFHGADTVVIWLGEDDEHTEVAYAFLSSWMKKVVQVLEASGKLKEGKLTAIDENVVEPSLEEFAALDRLFSRPWFSRAWTYQESWLSRNSIVQCGAFSILGTELFGPLLQIRQSSGACQNAWTMFCQRYFQSSSPPCLFDLCVQRRAVRATDPRDLVYSLLEVANDGRSVEPDYSKSVEEVYASLALQHILSKGNFDILTHIPKYIYRGDVNFPTWVPDWRTEMTRISGFTYPGRRKYDATGSATASPEPYGDWKVRPAIRVSGLLFEAITSPLWNPKPNEWPGVLMPLKAELQSLGLQTEVYEPTAEPFDHALLRTIFADMVPRRHGERPRWSRESFTAFLQKKPPLSFWQDAIQHESSVFQLAFTESCGMALVPFGSQEGDIIGLLLGAEVPVLLRPYEDGFIFIGECYVHGLMDGEGLVLARKCADPNYGHSSDTSWLQQLHEKPLPFNVDEFVLY